MLETAIAQYGHLLFYDRNVSAETFALLIALAYDITEPRNKAVFDYVGKLTGRFVYTENGTVIYVQV